MSQIENLASETKMMIDQKFLILIAVICLTTSMMGCGSVETDNETDSPQNPNLAVQTPLSSKENQTIIQERLVDGMQMVFVPGGTFRMGSTVADIEDAIALCRQHYPICNRWYYEREGPQHTVSLDGFWIDQTEVTNAQFRLCVDAGFCTEPSACKKGTPTFTDPNKTYHPVSCVNWKDAQAYCAWTGGRLPTEAEWEYAFRGKTGAVYPWGDEFDGSKLNYCDASCGESHADENFDDGFSTTAPAGRFASGVSWSGALNLSGNVSEWVADWFGAYTPEAVTNPLGPSTGKERMIKGCSWFSPPAYCRGSARHSVVPDTRFDYVGFRCVLPEKQVTGRETLSGSDPIPVRQGNRPTLDGIHSHGEWDPATIETFADGSQLFLIQNGEDLYVGIRASAPEMIAGNIYLQVGNEISVLHSSAALGIAIYQRTEAGWQKIKNFTWCCRSTGYSESAHAERVKFLQEEGWLAANGRMGTPNELEYQIKIPDQDFRLAVVFTRSTDPYEKIPWPADLNDACIQPTLGGFPEIMGFSPNLWSELALNNTD